MKTMSIIGIVLGALSFLLAIYFVDYDWEAASRAALIVPP